MKVSSWRFSPRNIYFLWTVVCFTFVATNYGCQSLQLHPNVGFVSSKSHRVRPMEMVMGQPNTSSCSETRLSMSGGESSSASPSSSFGSAVKSFTQKNSFLLSMAVAVAFAKLFPNLGKTGGILRPELFIGNYGVIFIFLISGLSLELSELTEAFANMKLNMLTQGLSFFAWPLLVGIPLVKLFRTICPNLLPGALLDGLLILTCLPTTVNMCVLLTSSAGGNVASALCNAVIGNILGIFVTPALLLRFFGTSIELPFVDMVIKLCNKVLLPVFVGQVLRTTKMKDVYMSKKKTFKSLQEFILIGIVWNAFCNAFTKGFGLSVTHAIVLLTLLPLLHVSSIGVLLSFFSLFSSFTKEQVVAATLCASHKTLAFGLPLINTVFEGNPNLASYVAPIMIIHPTQLIIGSLLVPKFQAFIGQRSKEE